MNTETLLSHNVKLFSPIETERKLKYLSTDLDLLLRKLVKTFNKKEKATSNHDH